MAYLPILALLEKSIQGPLRSWEYWSVEIVEPWRRLMEKIVVILREGMKIGADQAELKAILPGGIILVEKITNVYGEEEYLETVIPISR